MANPSATSTTKRATSVRPLLSNAGCRARMLTLMPAGAQPSDRLGRRMSRLHSNLPFNGVSLGRRCGHRAAFTGYRTPSSAALSLRARATDAPSSSKAGSAFQPAGLSNALGARPSAPQRQCMGPLTRPRLDGSCFALARNHYQQLQPPRFRRTIPRLHQGRTARPRGPTRPPSDCEPSAS